jgi:hypothetical protein
MKSLNICQNCGIEFETERSDAKYCSGKCRKAGNRNSHRNNIKSEEAEAIKFDRRMMSRILRLSLDDKARMHTLTEKYIKYNFPQEYKKLQIELYDRLKEVCSLILEYPSGTIVDQYVLEMFMLEIVVIDSRANIQLLRNQLKKITKVIQSSYDSPQINKNRVRFNYNSVNNFLISFRDMDLSKLKTA